MPTYQTPPFLSLEPLLLFTQYPYLHIPTPSSHHPTYLLTHSLPPPSPHVSFSRFTHSKLFIFPPPPHPSIPPSIPPNPTKGLSERPLERPARKRDF